MPATLHAFMTYDRKLSLIQKLGVIWFNEAQDLGLNAADMLMIAVLLGVLSASNNESFYENKRLEILSISSLINH